MCTICSHKMLTKENILYIPIYTFCSFFAGFPHADTLFRTIRIGVSLLNHPGWHQKQHENQGLILQPSHLHDVLEEGAEDDDKEDFPRPLSLIISGPGFEPNTWVSKNPTRVCVLIGWVWVGFISMFWRLRMWYQDLFFLSSCWWENLQREMEQQEDDGGGVGHIAVEEVPVVFWKAK